MARHFIKDIITDAKPANQQWWWWHHVIYREVDHRIQIDFYSTYFPGFAFSPSSAVSRLGCRVILLFISMAKPVSTLRWIASRTGFFFLPSSESYNKGEGRIRKMRKDKGVTLWPPLPPHSPSQVVSWSWTRTLPPFMHLPLVGQAHSRIPKWCQKSWTRGQHVGPFNNLRAKIFMLFSQHKWFTYSCLLIKLGWIKCFNTGIHYTFYPLRKKKKNMTHNYWMKCLKNTHYDHQGASVFHWAAGRPACPPVSF